MCCLIWDFEILCKQMMHWLHQTLICTWILGPRAHHCHSFLWNDYWAFCAMLKPIWSFTCLLIESLWELVDWRWYLQPGLEDSLLSLETNVFWPSDESAQISLGLDILSNSKVAWAFFEQWVNYPLLFWLFDGKRSCCYLLSLLLTLN